MSGNHIEHKAGCWAVMNFTLATQNEDSMSCRKTEHFKAHSSAIADHVKITGHNIRWDRFIDILAPGTRADGVSLAQPSHHAPLTINSL